MSEQISPEALDYLAYLKDPERPVRYTRGELSDKLIEAGLAEVYKQEETVPVFPIVLGPFVPHRAPTPITVYTDALRPTPQGIVYLEEHQEDLERLAEA